MWDRLVAFTEIHRVEIIAAIIFAVFFAVIFAIVFEVFGFNSRLQGLVRQAKNNWSERSVARLQKRIEQLEQYRDKLAAFMSSDKALYLHTFTYVITILLFMTLGILFFVLDYSGIMPERPHVLFSPFILGAVGCLTVAVLGGIQALKIAGLDTRSKVSEMVEKLDREISDLKAKLDVRLQQIGGAV